MRYGHARAKSRAFVAATTTTLVVVPLTGVAAVTLVTQDFSYNDEPQQVADVYADYAAGLAESQSQVVASSVAEYDFAVPNVSVQALPAPAPRRTTTTRTVANSASVTAAIAGSAVIAEASKHVGVRYTPGGKSPSTGFDCSGFVQYVYGQLGISLPGTSSAYYNVGTRVSSPQPGDIIVSPGHVGIYAGPNLQIDAPTSGKTIQFRGIWQKNPIYVRVTG